jgi:hypothetical protein
VFLPLSRTFFGEYAYGSQRQWHCFGGQGVSEDNSAHKRRELIASSIGGSRHFGGIQVKAKKSGIANERGTGERAGERARARNGTVLRPFSLFFFIPLFLQVHSRHRYRGSSRWRTKAVDLFKYLVSLRRARRQRWITRRGTARCPRRRPCL